MAWSLSRTEGLGRAKGESEEGFTSRVQAAKNARLEAEWRTRVQASKPRAGEIPLGPDGRPIPAFARATNAARALFDDGGGVFRKKGSDVLEMRKTGRGAGRGGGKGTRTSPFDKGPVAPERQAIFKSLRDQTAALRSKLEEAGLPAGKKNLAAARVVFKDGTAADSFSYSNMGLLNKAVAQGKLSPDVAGMFVGDGPMRVQAVDQGGFNFHTEPRLLNNVLNNMNIDNIQEVHLYTELPPCPSSCRPYAIGSWRAGGPVSGSLNAAIPPDMNPLTRNIPLYVYDKGGLEW